MPQVGRNDPCPCGSGKKYKACCLGKDRARRIRESSWRQGEQDLLDRLLAFAQRPEFRTQLLAASNLFWNGSYGMEGLMHLPREEVGRFFDWYVHDYRLEGSREQLVERFMRETGQSLLPAERARLAAWARSFICLYRLNGPVGDGMTAFTDMLQNIEVHMLETGIGRLGLPGDLVLGRVLESSPSAHFAWASLLLPASIGPELSDFLLRAFEGHRQMYPDETWPSFLSRHGYLFNHCLLRLAANGQLDSTKGIYYDPSSTLRILAEAEKRLQEQRAKDAEERAKQAKTAEESEAQGPRKTSGGVLIPAHADFREAKRRRP